MPNLDALKKGDLKQLRHHLSFYFNEIAHGMTQDARDFESMEYINFAILDILTGMYHSIPSERSHDKKRFISNLKNIVDGLERNDNA